jgi:superfamily II DNA helicase RecQ
MKDFAENLLALHIPNKTAYTKKYEDILSELELEKNNSEVNKQEMSQGEVVSTAEIPKKEAIRKDNNDLIKELKAFRLHQSREQNVKPYYIFSDNQMLDLIDKMPSDSSELQSVSGFGAIKANKYGARILEILKKYR